MPLKKLLKTKKGIWFYNQGWRVGKIVKRYSKTRITVKDCTGTRCRVMLDQKDRWIALSHFKNSDNLKEKNNGKKKIKKVKSKKWIKIKTKRWKLRKSNENTKDS